MFPLESVIQQLIYLNKVVAGAAGKDLLPTVNIGQIAAREFDEFDEELADLLHAVSAEVDKLDKE